MTAKKAKAGKLLDNHRIIPKAQGGEVTEDNIKVMVPAVHMAKHGNLRKRDEAMDTLKSLMDDRRQVLRAKQKLESQLLAYERGTDERPTNPGIIEFMETQLKQYKTELGKRTRLVEKHMAKVTEVDKLAEAAMNVPQVGPMTVAHCLIYLDLGGVFPELDGNDKPHPRAGQEKARHASSVWRYVGLDKPSHERYTKGEASGGNKTLRSALYCMAEAQMKSKTSPYRHIYDNVKTRLENSSKITKTKTTQGKLIDCAWKDTKKNHRHGAALRQVSKHFLADYWFVGRNLLGLPNGPCYAEAQLGGNHRTVNPRERGWEWDEVQVDIEEPPKRAVA